MTTARSDLMPPGQSGTFHIVARCVRRSFLWGFDSYTNQNYDHRKPWVEQRILLLSNAFAVSLLSYVVMSNKSWRHPPQSDLPYKPTPQTLSAKPAHTNHTAAMTQARKTLVDPAHAASYHCVSRCVRRSWLCGFDEYFEKSFEHRKPWVEQRILELGGIFACGIYAYAVMSNHYHLVVHMSPIAANDWSAHAVARRWVKLYPTGKSNTDQLKIDAILQNEALIKLFGSA